MSDLNSYMQEVRELIDAKGFSSREGRYWELFALIHSEVSEAVHLYKYGCAYAEIGCELADVVIRVLHLCSAMGLDIEELYREKMTENWARANLYNTKRGG